MGLRPFQPEVSILGMAQMEYTAPSLGRAISEVAGVIFMNLAFSNQEKRAKWPVATAQALGTENHLLLTKNNG